MFRGPVACTALLLLASVNHAAAQSAPTFSQQIAPILRTHCVACHQPGGDAPFSLLSFADARQRAQPDRRRHQPRGTCRRGSPTDAARFRRRAPSVRRTNRHDSSDGLRAGAPEGTPSDVPQPPTAASRLALGDTRSSRHASRVYAARRRSPTCFAISSSPFQAPAPVTSAAWQFRPGQPRPCTTPTSASIRRRASRRLDEARSAAGIRRHDPAFGRLPRRPFPRLDAGTSAAAAPPDSRGTSTPATISWSSSTCSRPASRNAFGRRSASTSPPTAPLAHADHRPARTAEPRHSRRRRRTTASTDAYVLPVDAEVRAIQPHAHYRARERQRVGGASGRRTRGR